ncbi:MAG: hypothetical protein WD532_01385 [Acidimicrobiia bacterium]
MLQRCGAAAGIGAFVLGLWIAIASLVLTIKEPAMVEHSMAGI